LGLYVSEVELDGVSGMLVPAERRVYINALDVAPRRHFTLAHEIGHWICQCLEGRAAAVLCRTEEVSLDPAVKALEREANIFAAELLMPEPAVRSTWSGSIPACAERFGVSAEAMHWRLFNFGLVGDPPS
jgi:Zn-dependent peptidase ImmA (M78 family)